MIRILKTREFSEWFQRLKDPRIRQSIQKRLSVIRQHEGLSGDYRYIGDGVTELRFHHGPGYRVYTGRFGNTLVVLLLGGDKSTQKRDVAQAKQLWAEWRNTYVR